MIKPPKACIICHFPFDNPQKGNSRRKFHDNGRKFVRKYCKDCAKDVIRKRSRDKARRLRNRIKKHCKMCNSALQFNRWAFCSDKCQTDFVKLNSLNRYLTNAKIRIKEWELKKQKILNRASHIKEILNK